MAKKHAPVEPEIRMESPTLFGMGEEMRIAKKSRVVDKKRAHENLPPDARVPIDMDVTGVKGKVCGTAYRSKSKGGELCVPLQLSDGNVLAVPANRLERAGGKAVRKDASDQAPPNGTSPVGSDSLKFWEAHFREKARLELENERLQRENEELKRKGTGK